MRFGPLTILVHFGVVAALPAADPPLPFRELRDVERHVRLAIESAEPSVVAVVVSRLKYPGPPPDRATGQLGGYEPPPRNQFGLTPPPAVARLDLADPQYVNDHQFGSGLVLERPAGGPGALILTSYHLIEGATKVYVRGSSGKGSYADIHAADARSDLAVLRLLDPVPGLEPVRFAEVKVAQEPGDDSATVYRGKAVLALGHPLASGFADGAASASWGVISNVRRRSAGPNREEAWYRNARGLHHYGSLIQTDARITLGCSGGGLFDLDGKLIGLTAPLAALTGSETAGGYAIPFDTNYRRIVRVLQEGREVEYGFLGVAIDARGGGDAGGVRISGVTPNSPAAAAGLAADPAGGDRGDVLLAIDGHRLRDADDLFLRVGSALAGSKVSLTVARGSRVRTAEAVLVKHYNPMPWVAAVRPPSVGGIRVDYASTLIGQTQAGGIPLGVLIREIEPNSPAADRLPAAAGQPDARWLIVGVNGRPIATPDDFLREAAGKPFLRLRLLDLTMNAVEPERVIELAPRPPLTEQP